MASSAALWRSAPPNGGHPSGPTSNLGRRSSFSCRTQRWHHMRQNLATMRTATPRSRDGSCLRLSRFKVWAQESSPLNSSSSIEGLCSEAGERGSSSKSGELTNQNLLLKLLILAVVVAALFTAFAALQFQSSNTLLGTIPAEAGRHYKLRLLGRDMLIGEQCPGWIYFWLLMAAGFGLFVSEEALNVWVGATLARTLTFNGLWMDLVTSVSANGFYIFSTVFWVYWPFCCSDKGRRHIKEKGGSE
eukprot:c21185_g1_i1 orf=59-796(+)